MLIFVLKCLDFVVKMFDFVLKLLDIAGEDLAECASREVWEETGVSKTDELCIKNEELCIKNDEFCI